MTEREGLIKLVRDAFEPIRPLSKATIDLYKSGWCDEEPSVGVWLETHPNIEDHDFNPALIAFLNMETARRIIPAILLGALNDPRFPNDHDWLYYNMRILASLFDDPVHEHEEYVRDFRNWFNAAQLSAFSDVLLHLSNEAEWSSISKLLARGARLLRTDLDSRMGVQP